MKKIALFLLGLLLLSAFLLVVVGMRRLGSTSPPRPIFVAEEDRDTPVNLLDKKQDRNYVTKISPSSNTLQIQGVISQIKRDSFTIWAQKNYSVVTNDKSVVECRDKFIKLPDGNLALAYTIYLDLSRYIATIQANREIYIKQGKLFAYNNAYQKIESDSWVTGVFQDQADKEKKYILDILLVYGCK